ncbi:methyltransferase [Shewanella donghaensis]|uniref:methyltransferase n=1 Tax=Shewanella donghaensis TaxID=238836 RepID=UPI001182E765|nr:methyltransferase [Shewanella donghaensis]
MRSDIAIHHNANSLQLTQISECLLRLKCLWQVKAFDCQTLPWIEQFPILADKVWAINDSDIDNIDVEQQLLIVTLLPALIEDLAQSGIVIDNLELILAQTSNTVTQSVFDDKLQCQPIDSQTGLLHEGLSESELAHFSAHIKGRKWQQITAFAANISTGKPIVEWCAGKGHLGRYIAKSHQADVISLEWQQNLCEQGQSFADKWQLSQQFYCVDVFNLSVSRLGSNPLNAEQHAIALHACGDLHIKLLELATEAKTQAISFSPCCYHLIQAEFYQPLSAAALASGLKLSRHDLQLPLQQSVIASEKLQTLRHQEIAWRLGFDSMQRDITGNDQYLPIPSIKRSQLSGSFTDFCHWAGKQKQVDTSTMTDFETYRVKGAARQRLTQRIDLVAHLFRRAIEQWLLLDRVCFLEQQGYQVSMIEFCANDITPRNRLIQAKKIT